MKWRFCDCVVERRRITLSRGHLEADLHDFISILAKAEQNCLFCNDILTCQNKNVFLLPKPKQNRAGQLGRKTLEGKLRTLSAKAKL